MNFLPRNKNQSPLQKIVVVIVVMCVVLTAGSFLMPGFFKTITYGISTPVWFARDAVGKEFSTITQYFSTQTSLIRKNEALTDQVTALSLKVGDYDAVSQENADLKNLFGRVQNKNRVLARVLSKPPQSPYDTFVIDAGTASGLRAGDKVYLSDTSIVGLVTEASAHTSLVTLFSASSQKTSAELSRTGTLFEIVGRGGGTMSATVPKESDVIWGDMFAYPALSTEIIGSVYYIETDAENSFKTLYIRAQSNVFSAQWVFVETVGN